MAANSPSGRITHAVVTELRDRGWLPREALQALVRAYEDQRAREPNLLLTEYLVDQGRISETQGQELEEALSARPVFAESAGERKIGVYDVVATLGRGGMGTVYRARAPDGRAVALKVIADDKADNETARSRFVRETQILQELDHPGIVRVLDAGAADGLPYIAMELVEGKTLEAHLNGSALPQEEALRLLGAICEAVGYIHAQGYVHRDLKPANILLDAAGRPRVTDFGLGRHVQSRTRLTATDRLVGTILYLPPEAIHLDEGQPRYEATPAADVFGLGVLMYEMLAGRLPFYDDTHLGVLAQIQWSDPRPLRELVPGLAPDVEAVCLKALAKKPAHRYPDARAMAEDLARARSGATLHGRPEPRRARLWRRLRRSRWIWAAGLLGLVALAVVITWSLKK